MLLRSCTRPSSISLRAQDDVLFVVEGAGAVAQFVFLRETGIEPLEFGVVPQQIGLFPGLDATDHFVLDEQRIADLAQQRPTAIPIRPRRRNISAKGSTRSKPMATRPS